MAKFLSLIFSKFKEKYFLLIFTVKLLHLLTLLQDLKKKIYFVFVWFCEVGKIYERKDISCTHKYFVIWYRIINTRIVYIFLFLKLCSYF